MSQQHRRNDFITNLIFSLLFYENFAFIFTLYGQKNVRSALILPIYFLSLLKTKQLDCSSIVNNIYKEIVLGIVKS
jgi:hypothetical protein